jgi:TupA-like ATPgrasp
VLTFPARAALRIPRNPVTAMRSVRRYARTFGRLPHLFPPRTYSEKILYRKLFDRRPYLTRTSDKYAVRAYVREKLGMDLFPEIYHLTADPRTIPFDTLPDRYVVKPTHGSGWIRLVPDGRAVDRGELVRVCDAWLAQDYSRRRDEWFYHDIPRRIIVEEYLGDDADRSPPDYKLLVFNQQVRVIQVDTDRRGLHRRNFFDAAWNELDIRDVREHGVAPVEKPPLLGEMIRCAEALAEDTDMVRVDLYAVKGRIYFGELTHTPGSGLSPLRPRIWDARWGAWWTMDFTSPATGARG